MKPGNLAGFFLRRVCRRTHKELCFVFGQWLPWWFRRDILSLLDLCCVFANPKRSVWLMFTAFKVPQWNRPLRKCNTFFVQAYWISPKNKTSQILLNGMKLSQFVWNGMFLLCVWSCCWQDSCVSCTSASCVGGVGLIKGLVQSDKLRTPNTSLALVVQQLRRKYFHGDLRCHLSPALSGRLSDDLSSLDARLPPGQRTKSKSTCNKTVEKIQDSCGQITRNDPRK